MAVSTVTDLWTRQAFVEADRLRQQQQGQERDVVPVSGAIGSLEAAATGAVSRKAVKVMKATGGTSADGGEGYQRWEA